jgi:hypothetical protein
VCVCDIGILSCQWWRACVRVICEEVYEISVLVCCKCIGVAEM